MAFEDGYCYLVWFVEAGFVGIDRVRACFGKYPRVRDVLACLYARVNGDVFLSGVIVKGYSVLHVDVGSGVHLFSDLLHCYMYSNARIGGDQQYEQSEKIKQLGTIAKLAGVSMDKVYADAATNIMRRECRENTSLVRDMIVADSVSKGAKSFDVYHKLSLSRLSLLQGEYPELNVVSSGRSNHPHAVAAAHRLCAEEFMLRLLNY